MAHQEQLVVNTQGRGTYDITPQINRIIKNTDTDIGLCHVFIRHTSASLMVTENADPSVRSDLETLIKRLAPDADPSYTHRLEGEDDMAAHARCMLTQTEITLPITNGQLNLGTWQSIFLWEHRYDDFTRTLTITII